MKRQSFAPELLLDLARPLLYLLPRGSGTLYRLLGGRSSHHAWHDRGLRLARGKDHGLLMRLDLANPFERETYYLGRFYEWGAAGSPRPFSQVGRDLH
jgi:hypothetical protein